jgi:uncharacterized protein YPO0396
MRGPNPIPGVKAMNSEMSATADLFGDAGAEASQFRLARIQTFNWGTFDKLFTFDISEKGYLFVGPSGSGKSTILDAHAALMTPPKWVDFNVAAREAERHGRDRNIITYIRGAWSQQTGDSGEYVSQYLRPDTTWSAISETYRDGRGRVVVLAQILWVRGKSTVTRDARKLYVVLQREFDVRELEFFPASDFETRRFKFDLPDAFVRDEFSAYQERFRYLLGIENERALRLLHKTQSAKNLGDLNTFLRDFMLDAPETFELADRLVSQFQELNEAHRAVVDARRQIETLQPAKDEAERLEAARLAKNELDELSAGIDPYREQKRKSLLEEAIRLAEAEIVGQAAEAARLGELAGREFEKLRVLQDKRAGAGGHLIEQLTRDISSAEGQRNERLAKREKAQTACAAMGWAYPEDATSFAGLVAEARQQVHGAPAWREQHADEQYALRQARERKDNDFKELRREIEAMERQRSNIPARMLDVRERLAKALNILEERLPFAGELIEVKAEEADWQGAIERVLGGFARSLLVSDKHYSAVSAYINDTHLGERLVYLRMTEFLPAGRSLSPNSLVKKLHFAAGPHRDWLVEEVKTHFDYECADSVQAFRSAPRALTREGQVKHNTTRHEKNDRRPVGDKSQWVLGFDNASKLKLYREQALALVDEIEGLKRVLTALLEAGRLNEERFIHCQTLANLTWAEVDVGSVLERISDLQSRLETERKAHPDLAVLDAQVVEQDRLYKHAVNAANEAEGGLRAKESVLARLEKRLSGLQEALLCVALTPFQLTGLDERLAQIPIPMELERVDEIVGRLERGIGAERTGLLTRIGEHEKKIERCFQTFVTTWPAEAGGLDPSIESAPDFFSKLARLIGDGLPEYEERFLRLLHEQSDQNLTRLSAQLDQERKAIRDRMDLVNESLKTAPYNPGTHLVIETTDRMLDDVRQFKQSLKESLSHSFSADPLMAERRFEVLNALVKRFSSQETVDRNWRALVLDVRLHVEFVARELDASGLEVEVYQSGAGKSGGQRQKLAATCLAAALRYQLGGQDRALPMFSTVVLDEAFDKADAEFTSMAMNIFKTFGFQMIVATPMKSVMTLEPFIGGACFVHIKDRKHSAVVLIDYDEDAQRLKLNSDTPDDEEAAVT